MNSAVVLVLIVRAIIIHLRLNTEDRAIISMMSFLFICAVLPITAEKIIPMITIGFIINVSR